MIGDNLYKIVIAGDLFPTISNSEKFISGDVEWLFGTEICRIFSESNYRICNLEGVLTNYTKPIEKIGPAIRNNPETINAMKAIGVDLFVTANNHIADFGMIGYQDTKRYLTESSINFIGSGDSEIDMSKYLIINANGKSVCVYNVAEEMFNELEEGRPGVNLYDEYRVCKELGQLRSTNDYVIVIYHGGTEYFPYPTPELKKRFHRMADNGASVVVAQHTHCIGCEEFYNNSYLLYGQGNFLFDRQKTPITHQGLFLELLIGSEIEIRKHYFHVERGQLYYDFNKGNDALKERSEHINDDKYLETQFSKFVATQIKDITKEWRKNGIFYRVARKFFPIFPKLYKRRIKYKQLLTIYYILKSEQKRETVLKLIKTNLTGEDKWFS